MSDVRREVKEYNQAVVNNTFLTQLAACPCCHFPRPSPSTTAPGASSASACSIRNTTNSSSKSSWRVRFRCNQCHAVFTEYPPFALPHKRLVKQDLLAKAHKYLAEQQAGEPTTYRESVREQHIPPSYANNDNGRQLSHVTLRSWLSWWGSLKPLVQRATQLVLQKNPQADLHCRCHTATCNWRPATSASPTAAYGAM